MNLKSNKTMNLFTLFNSNYKKMFKKLLIIIFLFLINCVFNSIQQLNQNIETNSETNNNISIDLNEPNNRTANETTINKTIVAQLLVEDLPTVPTPPPPNEMLSFEEWRKKIAEKSVQKEIPATNTGQQVVVNQSPQSQPSGAPVVQPSVSSSASASIPATPKQKPIIKRARNFGSNECGAKVVDKNPESESVQRILNEQTDEYMLNPCAAKIWFVIELCETIQPKAIELANFELYSSAPKEFNIQASDHYPTRDWSSLGTYTAQDERLVQRFPLQSNGFVKFVKIELLSHYGNEHFCPLSVVRIFGTSLFEEVERIDSLDTNHNSIGVTDEDNESPLNEEYIGEETSAQNLFGTARDAVFNIVRKAAQALNGNNIEVLENNSIKMNSSLTMNALIDLELVAIRLYPKVEKYLRNCNQINDSINCLYLKALFGEPLYALLIRQYLNETDNCLLFQCTSQPKNSPNESIKIESSIDSENINLISPTKPILNDDLHSKTVENMTLDQSIDVSEESKISITQTLSVQEMSSASEASVLSINTIESSSVSDIKNEDLSTIKDINNNNVLNISDSIGTKSEESIKDSTNNEINGQTSQSTTVPNTAQQQPPSPPQQQNGNNAYVISGSTTGQSKESVVIRLSNRIKALEVNLSLSSQYLEELSQRYRKQMEEMQRAFNITISKLNDTNIRAAERDLKQQESIASLETRLSILNNDMSVLLRERESLNWHYIEVHIALMMTEVVLVIVFLFVCVHRLSQRIQTIQSHQTVNETIVRTPVNNSINSLANSVSPHKRAHPNTNPCHLPPKAQRIEGENKPMDALTTSNSGANDNKPLNNQRKIRKKKKKPNVLNGISLSNSLESNLLPAEQENSEKLSNDCKQNSITKFKSQSTPLLVTNNGVKNITQIKENTELVLTNGCNTSGGNCSCHSSTSGVSGVSSQSTVSTNVTTNQLSNNEIKSSKSRNNSIKKSSNDKPFRRQSSTNSLTLSLKKLLKFERK